MYFLRNMLVWMLKMIEKQKMSNLKVTENENLK